MTRQSQRKFKKRAQLRRYLAGSALDAGTTRASRRWIRTRGGARRKSRSDAADELGRDLSGPAIT